MSLRQEMIDTLRRYADAIDYVDANYGLHARANGLDYDSVQIFSNVTRDMCDKAESSADISDDELVGRLKQYLIVVKHVDSCIGFVSMKYGVKYKGPQVLTSHTKDLIKRAEIC